MKAHRTPWIDVSLQVSFEETQMELLLRNGKRERRDAVVPVFRLPDGTEFTGRRLGENLRARIIRACKPSKGAR